MATDPEQRLLTAEEFLLMNFGPDQRAELDNGVIRMMTGGTRAHTRIQRNLILFLGNALRGGECGVYGPDTGVQTHGRSVRYPDVGVFCGDLERPEDDELRTMANARVVIEILSESTETIDLKTKLPEYQAVATIDTIVFVDPWRERLRVVQRTGPRWWSDRDHDDPVDLELPSLGLTIPHAEVFARRGVV